MQYHTIVKCIICFTEADFAFVGAVGLSMVNRIIRVL